MAFRKVTETYVIEPLAGTDATTAQSDYDSDKTFVDGRYNATTGTSGSAGFYDYVFDDANKKITLTRTTTEWVQPS